MRRSAGAMRMSTRTPRRDRLHDADASPVTLARANGFRNRPPGARGAKATHPPKTRTERVDLAHESRDPCDRRGQPSATAPRPSPRCPTPSPRFAGRSLKSLPTWSARIRRMRATTTGSSRRRSPYATTSSTGGWTRRAAYRDGRKRVYYFSLEFLIGRLLFDALGNLGLVAVAREALADLGVDLDRLRRARARCRARQRRPRSSRRVLHGEHGHARRSPRTATASATTTASSGRSSRTGGRTSCPRTGFRSAIPGSSSGRRSPTTVGFGGTVDSRESGDGGTRTCGVPPRR